MAPAVYLELNRQAELALARLAGVSGLVPSVDWLLYSAIRKEALLTSQIEGTQATLTDLSPMATQTPPLMATSNSPT
jgi:Fic family protein